MTGDSDQATAYANELLAMLVEQSAMQGCSDWPADLAAVLIGLGRGNDLRAIIADSMASTAWLEAAAAFADGDLEQAADQYANIGSLPDEAFARLRAAEQLLTTGQRAEATRNSTARSPSPARSKPMPTFARPRRYSLPLPSQHPPLLPSRSIETRTTRVR